MLVVAVINVDAYSFLAFSDLTCHLEDTGIDILWLHGAACKETELGSIDQKASPSSGKNISLVCHVTHGSVSLKIFPSVFLFPRSLGVFCYSK